MMIGKKLGGVVVLSGVILAACGGQPAAPPAAPVAEAPKVEAPVAPAAATTKLLLAGFATADKRNALGGEFGAWANDPAKTNDEVLLGMGTEGGGAWKITYDISAPSDHTFGGAWMKFPNLDASSYKNLLITVKNEAGSTPSFIVELKEGSDAAKKVGRFTITGVTGEYKTVSIPLTALAPMGPDVPGLSSFNPIYEMALVFDGACAGTNPKGAILIARIELE